MRPFILLLSLTLLSSVFSLPILDPGLEHKHCSSVSCFPRPDSLEAVTTEPHAKAHSSPHLVKRIGPGGERRSRTKERPVIDTSNLKGADRRETKFARGGAALINLFSNKKVQESIKNAFVNLGKNVKAKVDTDTAWQRTRKVNWARIHRREAEGQGTLLVRSPDAFLAELDMDME
ncbi:hypothetical protein M408DRAFT_330196 [Serendipita vermifera MAFF 305830]|uniref:Uncharacterized protein n=1 Tax=Serendipita vermifera MAFF 305830 TaxID=933852 RepID=A0A0C3B6E5_SERVB|nr:hypothetical protein M408DRAFT_330196 [Serendipita vermifera MAFF 305830]